MHREVSETSDRKVLFTLVLVTPIPYKAKVWLQLPYDNIFKSGEAVSSITTYKCAANYVRKIITKLIIRQRCRTV